MARDLADDTYYVTSGGKIPIRWTSPEASKLNYNYIHLFIIYLRHSTFGSIPLQATCGASGLFSTRSGL